MVKTSTLVLEGGWEWGLELCCQLSSSVTLVLASASGL